MEGLIDSFDEAPEEAFEAMPWIEPWSDIRPQMINFLLETTALSDLGDIHHWSIEHRAADTSIGLIGADHMTNTPEGDFNLGYWVRSTLQGRGIAGACIDAVLRWLAHCDPEAVVEVTVDPANRAGMATCHSLLRRWRGHCELDSVLRLKVHGVEVPHHNFLLPLSSVASKMEEGRG